MKEQLLFPLGRAGRRASGRLPEVDDLRDEPYRRGLFAGEGREPGEPVRCLGPCVVRLLQTQNAQVAGWEMGPGGGWGSQHECLQWHGEDQCFTWPPLWQYLRYWGWEITWPATHQTAGREWEDQQEVTTTSQLRRKQGYRRAVTVRMYRRLDHEIWRSCFTVSAVSATMWNDLACMFMWLQFSPSPDDKPLESRSLVSPLVPPPSAYNGSRPTAGVQWTCAAWRMTSVEMEPMWLDKWSTRDRWEAEAVRCCGESFQLGPWKNVEHMAGLVSHISAYFLVYLCLWEMILSCQQLSSLLLLLLSLFICCFFF